MNTDFHVFRCANDNWVVLSQNGSQLFATQRQGVAEAFGKALAHRARASLIVHQGGGPISHYSGRELTYAIEL